MYKILKNIIEMDDYSVQKLSNQPPEPFEWNTVEGTELNVSDCIGGKGKIEVKGNTYQEQLPNPEYPQEIKVVTGNNVIRHVGKNLLDLSNGISNHGITTTLKDDGSVDLKGTIDTEWFNMTVSSGKRTKIRLLPGKYTFSVNEALNFSLRIKAFYKNYPAEYFHITINPGKTSGTFTVPRECDNFYVYAYGLTTGTVIDLNIKLQLEEGSIPTPYEQYKEKDYKLDLWKENEFDKNNVNKLNAYIDSSNKITSSEATRTLYVECKKNTLYKISKAKSARFRVMYTTDIPAINRVVNGYIVNDTGEEIIIKTGNNAKYLCVFYYHANQDTLTEQAILESIQIQEAIELCKIDNYKDVLFKNVTGDENYNAELENGAWYKKKVIDKKFLDDEMYFANSGVTNVFYTPVITNYSRINNIPLCDNFKGFNNVDTAHSVNIINSVGFNNTYDYNRFYISFNGTIDELKDFLNERKPTLYYANDNPVYEKITDQTLISQLEALNKARWFKGVNHWWTETDNLEPNLKGTYRQAINE